MLLATLIKTFNGGNAGTSRYNIKAQALLYKDADTGSGFRMHWVWRFFINTWAGDTGWNPVYLEGGGTRYQTSIKYNRKGYKNYVLYTKVGGQFNVAYGATCSTTAAAYWTGGSKRTYKSTLAASVARYTVPRPSYSVTYNAAGGTGAPGNQTKVYGTNLKLSTTRPTRKDYNFLGWSSGQSDTSAEYQPGATYTTNANLKLFAVWELAHIRPLITDMSVQRCLADGTPDETGEYCLTTVAYLADTTEDPNNVISTVAVTVGGATDTKTVNEQSGEVAIVSSATLSTTSSYVVSATVTDSAFSSKTTEQRGLFASSGLKDGTYEIRFARATNMALDIPGSSTADGANVQLWSVNHSNAQVFYIDLDQTDGFTIRNVWSGKYIAVSGSTAKSGTNVIQWSSTSGTGQRWRIVDTGETVKIDGVTCPIVRIGSYVTPDADTYYLDVSGARTTNKTNVQIWTKNGTVAQVFALYPTTRQDKTLPVPSPNGWSSEVGKTDYSYKRAQAGELFPAWRGTTSWSNVTTNGFEGRWRERTMNAASSAWNEWSEMTPWADLDIYREGSSYWLESGLPALLDNGTKGRQYEFQLRAFAGVDSNRTRGLEASMTLDALIVPSVTLSEAAFGPSGLRIPYASDYDGGMTNIQVSSIKVGDKEILTGAKTFNGIAVDGTLDISAKDLSGWVDDGSTIVVTYKVGSDLMPLFPDIYEEEVMVSYDAGSMTIEPTITPIEGRRLKIEADGSVVGAWYRIDDTLYPAEIVNGTAYIDYPFSPFELFISMDNGEDWGMVHMPMSIGSGVLIDQTPCHAWRWKDNSFLLECDLNPLVTDRSIKPLSETMALNGREYQNVYFQGPIASEYTATGVISEGLTESTVDQLIALARAHHVTYRSPFGEVATVAIVGVTYKEHDKYTEVTVNMIEETW